jgi:hypothetical protein
MSNKPTIRIPAQGRTVAVVEGGEEEEESSDRSKPRASE